LHDIARLTGGFIGVGTLTDCREYPTVEAFRADQAAHLNDPSWFEAPLLYGFVFTDLSVQEFRRYPGWVRIFEVKDEPPRRRRRRG
jgi:hypothetical protein